MTEFDLLGTAARGMDVQRSLLDIAARNVAAAQASTPGHPYARLVATAAAPDDDAADPFDGGASGGLSVHAEPGEGDALTEMLAVLDAQRAYEAGASVFDIGKRIAERTIDIGRA